MPLYEYQCQSCGDLSEVIQRMSDPPLSTCEACGGDLKKLLSAPAFQFKGTGWYVTDYPNSKEAKRKEEGADSGDSKDRTSGKSEASSSEGSASSKGSSDSESSSKTSKPTGKTKSERIISKSSD